LHNCMEHSAVLLCMLGFRMQAQLLAWYCHAAGLQRTVPGAFPAGSGSNGRKGGTVIIIM